MAKINFTAISGSYGVYAEAGSFITVTVPPSQVETFKSRLTIKNKSNSFRMKQIMESIARMNRIPEQSQSIKDTVTRLLLEYKELQANEKKEYFEEQANGKFIIPPGLWYICEKIEGNVHLNTEVPMTWHDARSRQYQLDAIKTLLNYKRATAVLATGLGKSIIISGLAKNMEAAGKRVVIVVPTEELVKQMMQTLSAVSNSVTGAGGGRNPKPGCNILVTTAASAIKYIDVYDTVVIDECLTHNQKISTNEGPIPIGVLYKKWKSRQQLPLVLSFNKETKIFEYKRITHAWKNTNQKRVLQIKSSKIKVTCTEDHLVFTQNKGWVYAKNLEEGDLLIGPYKKGIKQDLGSKILTDDQRDFLIGSYLGDGHFHEVSKNRYRVQFIHAEKQKEYIKWKKKSHGRV